MRFSSKKKGQLFFTEGFVWILGFLVIILSLVILNIVGTSEKQNFEALPNSMISPLPSAALHTFLHIELNSSEKIQLGFPEDERVHIKDLLQMQVHENLQLQQFIEAKRLEYERSLFEIDANFFRAYVNFMRETRFDYRPQTIIAVSGMPEFDPGAQSYLGIIISFNVQNLDSIDSFVRRDGFFYAIPIAENPANFNVISIRGLIQ